MAIAAKPRPDPGRWVRRWNNPVRRSSPPALLDSADGVRPASIGLVFRLDGACRRPEVPTGPDLSRGA
jgi:hypothetical protein